MSWTLSFQDGTLLVEGAKVSDLPAGFRWDERLSQLRGPAHLYGEVIYAAIEAKISYVDNAAGWEPLTTPEGTQRQPRQYQYEAVQAWIANKRRGIVCLPTGAGKTFVAEMCIKRTKRPTLVVAPTLDLVGQWYDRLKTVFQQEVGILGGGHHEILPLTVTTYDSAHLYLAVAGGLPEAAAWGLEELPMDLHFALPGVLLVSTVILSALVGAIPMAFFGIALFERLLDLPSIGLSAGPLLGVYGIGLVLGNIRSFVWSNTVRRNGVTTVIASLVTCCVLILWL